MLLLHVLCEPCLVVEQFVAFCALKVCESLIFVMAHQMLAPGPLRDVLSFCDRHTLFCSKTVCNVVFQIRTALSDGKTESVFLHRPAGPVSRKF